MSELRSVPTRLSSVLYGATLHVSPTWRWECHCYLMSFAATTLRLCPTLSPLVESSRIRFPLRRYSLVTKLAKHMQLGPSSSPSSSHQLGFLIAIAVVAVVGVGASILIGVKCWRRGCRCSRKKSLLNEVLNSSVDDCDLAKPRVGIKNRS